MIVNSISSLEASPALSSCPTKGLLCCTLSVASKGSSLLYEPDQYASGHEHLMVGGWPPWACGYSTVQKPSFFKRRATNSQSHSVVYSSNFIKPLICLPVPLDILLSGLGWDEAVVTLCVLSSSPWTWLLPAGGKCSSLSVLFVLVFW